MTGVRWPLGRHVEHDPRSRGFAVAAPAGSVVPPPRVWRRWSPILDQGDTGSCTGQAMAGWLGCEPHTTSAAGAVMFSEACALALYSSATRLDAVPGAWPPDDTGSTGVAVARAAKRSGLIAGYRWCFTTSALLHALQAGPVIVGTAWTDGMFAPDARGRVESMGTVAGGHEYLIRGTRADPDAPGGVVLVADNSWGVGWGVGGSFELTLSTWAWLRSQQADVTVPIAVGRP